MTSDDIRIGQGFDVHPFSDDPDRPLVLGGVTFPGATGLVGHSDADVIAHALTDAILGAAALGDIGSFFPDTDEAHRDADSIMLLANAMKTVADNGWHVINADVTVILDEPKLAPERDRMKANLEDVVGAPVSIKGKRTEGVAGLGGGIQAHAVALLGRSSGRDTP